MKITKRVERTAAIALMMALAVAFMVLACYSKAGSVNKNPDGIAIKGYDPVAYFTEGKPVKGGPEFEYEWGGAKWRFANAEHMKLFVGAPEKYAPQYGGY